MEDQWLAYAKRLQAIASTGLHYARDPFDNERYAEVASIARDMLAALGGAYLDAGRAADALEADRRAVELAPASADAHNELGLAQLDLGEFEEAAARFRR